MILPSQGRSFDPTRIPEAVRKAGFSAPEVSFTAQGQLEEEGTGLVLRIPGSPQPFHLKEGAQIEALKREWKKRSGGSVRITGLLQASRNRPPGLTVEQFEFEP